MPEKSPGEGAQPSPARPAADQSTQLHVPAAADPAATLAETLARDESPRVPGIAPPGYEILGELGRGGMGVVYKARQVKANRLVALKMILAGGHADAEELRRFRTEGEAVARLQHPGIVGLFEVGEHEGRAFFSLEYCHGGSLDRQLGGTPLPPLRAAALVQHVALAVHAAHQARVVHRDLKPANVLLAADGTPKITDFGLARKLDEQGQTQTGTVMGTPSYMAPEQAQGKKEVGPAADVYALGAILYECLTGRPPFKAATTLDTLHLVIHQDPVTVRRLNARTPADLETIALKCLQKQPQKRYASAAALAEDLRRYLEGEPIVARPVGVAERAWRWCRRNPAALVLAGLWLLVLLFFLALRGGAEQHLLAMKAVGQDSVPSIIAAQRIKAALAALHGDAANGLLHAPGEEKLAADYESRRLEATEGILEAAGNVTYGEAEKAPLRRLLIGLGAYEGAVAQAVILHARSDLQGSLDQYRRADALVEKDLLPAADELDEVNSDALEQQYAALRAVSLRSQLGVGLTGLLLIGALVAAQRLLRRWTGGRINPGLLAATLLAVVLLVYGVAVLAAREGALKRAKVDAFHSIHHLWQARAVAHDARGDRSRWLLDRPRAAAYEKALLAKMARIARRPATMADAELVDAAAGGELPPGFDGFLAGVLANITFAGEREAAVSALKAFLRYAAVDRSVRDLETKGRHEQAVRLCVGSGSEGASEAFAQLDAALDASIAINQKELDRIVASSSKDLRRVELAAPLAALGIALLSFFGLLSHLRAHAAG
jgi:tRNA A-37 threonylcarbamoyl transferase component Bud32